MGSRNITEVPISMSTRYQVFVSSTYVDLKDERRAVMQNLLEMDCIPAGMEMFPATDDSAWELIKKTIDLSDCHILIVGNRYGSLDESGVSFTEKEYEYARSKGIIVMAFLHINPDSLSVHKSDIDMGRREALKRFREKVERNHTCKYWSNSMELGACVLSAVNHAIRNTPMVGWVRGDLAKTIEDAEKVQELHEKLASATNELEGLRKQANAKPNAESRGTQIARELKHIYDSLSFQIDLAGGGNPNKINRLLLNDAVDCISKSYERIVELGIELQSNGRHEFVPLLQECLRSLNDLRGFNVELHKDEDRKQYINKVYQATFTLLALVQQMDTANKR